ncbi:LysR family transcriptional regulator [Deinococcus sp.]|uniref:LysR family transcriptional regulator n=1 Tax=Deinococcus sp. TaxID=47478 RepID=UPI003CC5F219
MTRMDVSALTLFVEVMRRGSFAAAARARNLDPSSVSRTVAALETELGLRLFQRSTRRLAPTEAGQLYFDRVEPLLAELDGARLQAADLETRPQGTLRIAAPVSFAQLNLVPLLPELARLYPDLAFDLMLTDAAPDLLGERLDVALRLTTGAGAGDSSLLLTPLVGRVCASPGYLARHGRPATPADLSAHTCLLLNMPGFSDTWRFEAVDGTRSKVQVSGRLQTSNAVALKECALSGLGIILQGRWIVGRELRRGDLIDLFPEHRVTSASFDAVGIWVMYPNRAYLPLKVRVFVEFLQGKFAAGAPWDSE